MRAASIRIVMLALLVGGAGAYAPPARADCAGFTDVLSGGSCTAITWIKNRQITLGCASTTLYCPGDPVTRIAMAAFLNRLADILATEVLDKESVGNSLNLAVGPSYLCQTDLLPAVNYPRTAVAQASISYTLSGLQDVVFGVSTSLNGSPFNFGAPLIALNGAGLHQHHYVTTQQAIAPGSTYRFAIRVARLGSRPAPFGAWGCHLQVSIANAFGSQ